MDSRGRSGGDGSKQRRAYLGIFSTVTALKPAGAGGYTLATEIDRLALYADPGLTQPLKTFAIEQNVADRGPAGEILAIMPSSNLAVLPIIAQLSDRLDFVSRVIEQGHIYQQANEFDRDQVLANELLRVDHARSTPLWLTGSVGLGEYDRDRQSFEVESLQLRAGPNSSHDYRSAVDIALRQPEQLASVPAADDSARAAIEHFQDRNFQLLARATPVAAAAKDRGSRIRGDLQVDLDLVYVFRQDRKDMFVLARFQPPAADPAIAALGTNDQIVDAAATPSGASEVGSGLAPSTPQPDNFPADVVGLRLGMSFAEAEAIIRSHMAVGEVLDATRQPLPDPDLVVPYSSGRLYVSEDGMEFVQIFDEPPAAPGKVAAVVRWLHRPQGSLGADAALAALTEKYGEPAVIKGGTRPTFSWGRFASERRCDPGRVGSSGAKWDAGGQGLASLSLPEQINLRTMPGIGFQVGSAAHADQCGPIISARVESGRTDTLTIWLADQGSYATTIAESRARVENGESTDGAVVPAGTPDLKL